MIKPKRLEIGDTIGIVAPAGPASKERVEKGIGKLLDKGFQVVIGENCYSKYGYLSAKDEFRAAEFNHMFKDKKIDGILCLKGGYGSPRILNLLDYELIQKNPKPFIGYSDITALHIALNQRSHLVTFHGPMPASDMAKDFSDFSMSSLLNAVGYEKFNPIIKNATREIRTINSGIAEGQIIGGNLTLLTNSIGTPYEVDTKGKILFIEEIEESTYKIDMMFNKLILANKFKDSVGILLGDFKNCEPEREGEFTVEQLIDDLIKPQNKPTISNLQAGHCEPVITLPFGVNVRLNATKGEIIVLEEPTMEQNDLYHL